MISNPCVLFVDDDPLLLQGLARVLRSEPYDIATAPDSLRALSLLKDRKIDVIVSDEKMPGIEGTEFLRIAAARYPATVRIMLTGNPDLETAVKAINQGEIYRFLTKPCDEIELRVCIRQALQHRALLTQAYRLLETLKMQASYINHLEQEHPGISRIKKDQSGSIVIKEVPYDLETLLKEIDAELKPQSKP
jgi:two-component system probable response regulator PhcQ